MHQDPDALEDLMARRKQVLVGDAPWAALERDDADEVVSEEGEEIRGPAAVSGYETPRFGYDYEV